LSPILVIKSDGTLSRINLFSSVSSGLRHTEYRLHGSGVFSGRGVGGGFIELFIYGGVGGSIKGATSSFKLFISGIISGGYVKLCGGGGVFIVGGVGNGWFIVILKRYRWGVG
jgi:hypothetical protein